MEGARDMTQGERERWTRVGMLSALALVLGYLETFVPIPVPGVKLGLANIAVLVALDDGDVAGAFCVGAIKVLAVGLLFGNPLTMAYSALGTLLAFAVMAPLSRIAGIHIVLVSAAGALAHIVGQVVMAMALLGTPLVWYSLPLLEVLAVLTGVLCGAVTARALAVRDRLAVDGEAPADDEADVGAQDFASELTASDGTATAGGAREQEPAPSDVRESLALPAGRAGRGRVKLDPKAALVGLVIFMLAVFNVRGTVPLVVCMALAAVACILGRTGARTILRALRPLLLILAITFVAQAASFQQGNAVAQLGPVIITAEALDQTWVMFARLVSVVGASAAVMQLVDLPDLVGAIRWLVGPLSRLGVRTEGFCLALEVALASVPAVLELARHREWGWKELWSTAPAFIAEAVSWR